MGKGKNYRGNYTEDEIKAVEDFVEEFGAVEGQITKLFDNPGFGETERSSYAEDKSVASCPRWNRFFRSNSS